MNLLTLFISNYRRCITLRGQSVNRQSPGLARASDQVENTGKGQHITFHTLDYRKCTTYSFLQILWVHGAWFSESVWKHMKKLTSSTLNYRKCIKTYSFLQIRRVHGTRFSESVRKHMKNHTFSTLSYRKCIKTYSFQQTLKDRVLEGWAPRVLKGLRA